ncbi:YgjV family protein [Shewanella yunxiaonensis]|uniref:YgjV family protein n=1 Tax=Shewanella yunxiaonensis TaxID=2829809 RepID=A0ABX7YS56_9GAMM|nr:MULTISPECIES: YgjV family protein [Shewanella]MDF0535200.1 YgjV family protein [Shewanella sp. A32]QUN05610.1 YgjV family protein [Shewanella yunxiaonensis]
MATINTVELVGYSASLMVALSLMMKDIVRLRWVNLGGCGLFVAYGLAIDSWPVVSMNAFGACVNLYYLFKSYRHSAMLS